MRLRFPTRDLADLELGAGVHAIGRDSEGLAALVDDPATALAQFCVDRRGVWLQLRDGVRGVHVNGRPVRRMAMLRAGDAVYIDGVELLLLGAQPASAPPMEPGREPQDPRMVLRGIGGPHHGRCFSLDRIRRVGRGSDCDIRFAAPTFAEHHAAIEPHDDGAALRDLGSSTDTVINGHRVRDALLRPGDQLVFDGQFRFVVESPKSAVVPPSIDDDETSEALVVEDAPALARAWSFRRMPWLLLAALMLSGALSLLLVYGAR